MIGDATLVKYLNVRNIGSENMATVEGTQYMVMNKDEARTLVMHAMSILAVNFCMKKKFDKNIIGPSPSEHNPAITGSNPNEFFRDNGNAIDAAIAPKYVENPRIINRKKTRDFLGHDLVTPGEPIREGGRENRRTTRLSGKYA